MVQVRAVRGMARLIFGSVARGDKKQIRETTPLGPHYPSGSGRVAHCAACTVTARPPAHMPQGGTVRGTLRRTQGLAVDAEVAARAHCRRPRRVNRGLGLRRVLPAGYLVLTWRAALGRTVSKLHLINKNFGRVG